MGASKIRIDVSVEKPAPLEENAAEFPLSGSSYTDEQLNGMCNEIIDAIDREDPIDDMFVDAFIAGMQFGVVREGAETHGMSVKEFARNSYGWCLRHVVELETQRTIAHFFGK